MADIQVSPVADNVSATGSSGSRVDVWTTHLIGYSFYVRSNVGANGSIYYVKTTDGGETWSSSTKVNSTTEEANATNQWSVYYDQWTPGITTTLIHIAWLERISNAFGYLAPTKYRALQTSDDSLGTEVQLFTSDCSSGLCGSASSGESPSMVRARGGNLYLWHRAGPGVADQWRFYRSVDSGATWTERAKRPGTATVIQPKLLPGGESDSNDILLIATRASAISYWIYDDSADSWTDSGTVDTSGFGSAIEAEGATRKSDNNTFVAYMMKNADSTHTLRIIEITTGVSFTQRTNLFADEAGHDTTPRNQVAVALDAVSASDIYVGYGGTVADTTQQGFKKSTDGAVTWGAQQTFGEDSVTSRTGIFLAMNTSAVGGRIYGTWQQGPSVDILGNFNTSIALQASGGSGNYPSQMHNKRARKSERRIQGLRVP
mgnify:CR=1 FL=1